MRIEIDFYDTRNAAFEDMDADDKLEWVMSACKARLLRSCVTNINGYPVHILDENGNTVVEITVWE